MAIISSTSSVSTEEFTTDQIYRRMLLNVYNLNGTDSTANTSFSTYKPAVAGPKPKAQNINSGASGTPDLLGTPSTLLFGSTGALGLGKGKPSISTPDRVDRGQPFSVDFSNRSKPIAPNVEDNAIVQRLKTLQPTEPDVIIGNQLALAKDVAINQGIKLYEKGQFQGITPPRALPMPPFHTRYDVIFPFPLPNSMNPDSGFGNLPFAQQTAVEQQLSGSIQDATASKTSGGGVPSYSPRTSTDPSTTGSGTSAGQQQEPDRNPRQTVFTPPKKLTLLA